MADREIADVSDKVEKSDHSDSTTKETAEEAVSDGGKKGKENHNIRIKSDKLRNQESLSDMQLEALPEGHPERIKLEDNRFELIDPDENKAESENMTTGQMLAAGEDAARLMLDAIKTMEPDKQTAAKKSLKTSYQEVISAGYVPVSNPLEEEAGVHKAINPNEIKDPGIPDDAIALDPKDIENALKNAGKTIKRKGAEFSHDLTKEGAILDDVSHPYKQNPDQLMDYNACKIAWNSFPAFSRHPNLDPVILPAIIRNEIRHLRQDDKLIWNPLAEHESGLEKGRTIGPANMQTMNIDRLVKKYPQLTDPELGGIDPKHPYRDALKPEKSAWLAAAYLADYIETRETSGTSSITHHDLVKSYNPGADQKEQFNLIKKQILHIKRHHP